MADRCWHDPGTTQCIVHIYVANKSTEEQFKTTILARLKAIESRSVISAFDGDTGLADVESGAADDDTYGQIGNLLRNWLDEEKPPILTYQILRGTA